MVNGQWSTQVQSALFLFGYFLFLVTERERTSTDLIHHQADDATDDDHEDGIGLEAGGGDEG